MKCNLKKINFKLMLFVIFIVVLIKYLVNNLLSLNEFALFYVGFFTIIITCFMIVFSLIVGSVYFVKVVIKKEIYINKKLPIIVAATVILTISSQILIEEQNKYHHVVSSNWSIDLPNNYKEVYHTSEGPSFHGDGDRYTVLQYEKNDAIKNALEWQLQSGPIEKDIITIIDSLNVPSIYYPEIHLEYKYFYKIDNDNSELYILFDEVNNKIFIIESFL